jgi:hypothetical protein
MVNFWVDQGKIEEKRRICDAINMISYLLPAGPQSLLYLWVLHFRKSQGSTGTRNVRATTIPPGQFAQLTVTCQIRMLSNYSIVGKGSSVFFPSLNLQITVIKTGFFPPSPWDKLKYFVLEWVKSYKYIDVSFFLCLSARCAANWNAHYRAYSTKDNGRKTHPEGEFMNSLREC